MVLGGNAGGDDRRPGRQLCRFRAGGDRRRYGFYVVIGVSIIQTIHFFIKTGPVSFPSQVRFVYTLLVIIALFDPTRILYWMLLVGTFMVTFFDRCIIARVLILMPWNRGERLV